MQIQAEVPASDSFLATEIVPRARAWMLYKPFRVALALAVALVAGWLLVGKLSSGLVDQMVENYGYQYRFKFYTHALPTTIEGEAAVGTKQGIFAMGSPTKSSLVSDCSEMGSSWSQAFVAKIAGMTEPVCGRADGDAYIYDAYFTADGVTHLFTITYFISVAQAAQHTPDTAKLQAIFNSVRVTPQPQN